MVLDINCLEAHSLFDVATKVKILTNEIENIYNALAVDVEQHVQLCFPGITRLQTMLDGIRYLLPQSR